MWTPKRIGLLTLGLTVFVSAFLIYSHFLGGIDGLPPLPESYWPDAAAGNMPLEGPATPPENQVDRKLRLAFGEECPELQRPFKVEVGSKGLVLAFGEFALQPDGRVRLSPVSIAVFSKKVLPGHHPEINTVRSRVAYLVFDRPISRLYDMSKSKVVGGELHQDIVIINNRRTPQRDDDLSLLTQGPIHYQEVANRIWTDNVIELTDMQSRPAPTKINATGLDLNLTPSDATAKGKPAPGKPRGEPIAGVERVVLRSGVEMHLWVDGRSGFLAADAKESPEPKAAAEKAHVIITTQGPFCYDVANDRATFDVAPRQSRFPDPVLVKRLHEPVSVGKVDQLDCEHLELQFRRKSAGKGPAGNDRALDLEIESVRATGGQVTLTSDAETLVAHGTELTYNATTRETVLRGEKEMVALKEGNEIHARELRLLEKDGLREAIAVGPGQIDLLDRARGRRTLHARWNDKLVSSREGNFDVLTLTGTASFLDKDQDQELQADTLKVWLEGGQKPANGRKPHHLEATGKVRARSRELDVHDTDRFIVWFTDTPAPSSDAPAASVQTAAKPLIPMVPGTPAAPDVPAGPPKPARPIDLSAHLVEAWVNRAGAGGKAELDRLRTEGNVRVRQAPENPEDRGVDIRGDVLQLTHRPEGNVLVVTGDLAQLQMSKIFIIGPEVNIDQAANKAWVNGIGAMQMESETDFHGAKLKQPVPLVVHWNKAMFFNGRSAEFHGGIQAEQDNARLACQSLQVSFDRPISLKEGNDRGAPKPRVQHLVCDGTVRVEDSTRRDNKLVRYQRIEAPALSLDNEDGVVNASGPGTVRILQPGDADPTAAANPQQPTPTAAKEQTLKLTRVTYLGRMHAEQAKHMAAFYDDVNVVHLPAESPDTAVDLDRLPPGALHLQCDRLKVYDRPDEGKGRQEMEATGRVRVRSPEFYGRAEVVTYNEAKEQVIFDGGPGGEVILSLLKEQGKQPEQLRGQKIIYLRRTGQFQIIGGHGIRVP